MQVDRSCFLQNAAEFDESRSHHSEIRHHVAVSEEGTEGTHCLSDTASAFYNRLESVFGIDIPLPGVLKRCDLRTGAGSVLLGEEHVVIGAAVEGRVEVDQVYRLIFDVVA
jgi:hypothetical protein